MAAQPVLGAGTKCSAVDSSSNNAVLLSYMLRLCVTVTKMDAGLPNRCLASTILKGGKNTSVPNYCSPDSCTT